MVSVGAMVSADGAGVLCVVKPGSLNVAWDVGFGCCMWNSEGCRGFYRLGVSITGNGGGGGGRDRFLCDEKLLLIKSY